MQARHPARHLLGRGAVATAADLATFTGLYPALAHVVAARSRARDPGGAGAVGALGTISREWVAAAALATLRPTGIFGLPGQRQAGRRPVVLVHGYAMNRTNFVLLALRLRRAGWGPIIGFEYWTLGSVARAASQLGALVDQLRATHQAAQVDVVGHSMGGVVGRYLVSLGGGDGAVRTLVTLGSPHRGTDAALLGFGRPIRELAPASPLIQRLSAAPPPGQTHLTVIYSHADALVPPSAARVEGAEHVAFADVAHLGLLVDGRVAAAVIAALGR